MFKNLTNNLSTALRKVVGRGRLTEENIKSTLKQVHIALLEADVALSVVRAFIDSVKERALNHIVHHDFTPGQELLKIVKKELIVAMGEKNYTLNLKTTPPAVVLIAGQQGMGKTTSVGKLGKFLHHQYNKKILTVSTDIYRPAAIKQLEIITEQIDVDFYPSDVNETPVNIAKNALHHAQLKFYDVLLVDTAGRLHTHDFMMRELHDICVAIQPIETLLVVDAMIGQDAVNVAKEFSAALPLTGIILTKVDSDARGGAALSMRHVTGKPIKFIGTGEKIETLEPFYPERIASRILGMGDMLSLIEEIERKIDHKTAKKLSHSFKKNHTFNLNDFLEQLKQLRKMGGMVNLIEKLPGMINLPDIVKAQLNDASLQRMEAIIKSMTYIERSHPEIIKGSRKRRIASGSGLSVQDINQFLKQFYDMQTLMKKVKQGGATSMMRKIQEIMPSSFSKH
ncbi:signal recognition particle protein [Candidatus Erwinia haradaeae]|uniref:Signal recognition particle protein n=1 Tax=Candidatus Erwinia haradaeae TaxID=1922217 RepID=A0A451DAX3_9GAMM|nr:signal recognition particle protein [Candidatus Erwinia haradaeae]VFP83406.1 Signal recognition particle protein [Candidatus Erwinia haradaeae]